MDRLIDKTFFAVFWGVGGRSGGGLDGGAGAGGSLESRGTPEIVVSRRREHHFRLGGCAGRSRVPEGGSGGLPELTEGHFGGLGSSFWTLRRSFLSFRE